MRLCWSRWKDVIEIICLWCANPKICWFQWGRSSSATTEVFAVKPAPKCNPFQTILKRRHPAFDDTLIYCVPWCTMLEAGTSCVADSGFLFRRLRPEKFWFVDVRGKKNNGPMSCARAKLWIQEDNQTESALAAILPKDVILQVERHDIFTCLKMISSLEILTCSAWGSLKAQSSSSADKIWTIYVNVSWIMLNLIQLFE